MKTKNVMALVHEVLSSSGITLSTGGINQPDIINKVFLEIEKNKNWLKKYNAEVKKLGADIVNQWLAKYIFAKVTRPVIGRQRRRSTSKIIQTYTWITFGEVAKKKISRKKQPV